MRAISVSLLSLILLLCPLAAARAQSLGELARKEKQRREQVDAQSRAITNEQTERYKNGAVTTGTAAAAPDKKPQSGEANAEEKKGEPDEPVDFVGRPESYWRATMTAARQRVKDLENRATAIVLALNDLQNQFYREDNGYKQQEIQREMQKGYYEQDATKEDLAKARAALEDLEKEARRSGALPGWLR